MKVRFRHWLMGLGAAFALNSSCFLPSLHAQEVVISDDAENEWVDDEEDEELVPAEQVSYQGPSSVQQPSLPGGSNRSQPNSPATPRSTNSSSRSQRSRYVAQRERPYAFGESLSPVIRGQFGQVAPETASAALAGGARRMRVVDNNRALPTDRFLFSFQTYQNALTQGVIGGPIRNVSLQQYTVGFEKTFRDGTASLDLRMPFTSNFNTNSAAGGVDGGSFGNLNLKLKQALILEDAIVFSAGLGIDTPTGSSVRLRSQAANFQLDNNALFLQPFLAMDLGGDSIFYTSFLSVDTPTNGNLFRRQQLGVVPVIGRFNDQTMLISNHSFGRWLLRDRNAPVLRGVAGVIELHYATTLQNADVVANQAGGQPVITNPGNRIDTLNMTFGTQFNIYRSMLRFSYVTPLRNNNDQLFSNEFAVQFNRLF